jgi:hypothetical protein
MVIPPTALPLTTFRPVYFHLFLVGWISQLIFGVVYWLFPPTENAPHTGWIVLILLNVGLLLRAVGEPRTSGSSGDFWGWVLVAAAILQWLAILAFVAQAWPRSRERRPPGARDASA